MHSYTVKSGDTLSQISASVLGNAALWPVLFFMNLDMIHDPNLIFTGEVLRVP